MTPSPWRDRDQHRCAGDSGGGQLHDYPQAAATGGTFTAGNYTIAYVNGALTVNKTTLTITANNDSKTYGQTWTFGSGSTQFTSKPACRTANRSTPSPAWRVRRQRRWRRRRCRSATRSPSFLRGHRRHVQRVEQLHLASAHVNGTLTVTPAALTVTASAESKTYGQTVTFGSGSTLFSSSGLQNGETIGAVTLAVSNNGGAATAAVGSYTITPSAATGGTFTASNYTIIYNTGTLMVNPAHLTVTAAGKSMTYGGTVPRR